MEGVAARRESLHQPVTQHGGQVIRLMNAGGDTFHDLETPTHKRVFPRTRCSNAERWACSAFPGRGTEALRAIFNEKAWGNSADRWHNGGYSVGHFRFGAFG